jgi:hypothetical protein
MRVLAVAAIARQEMRALAVAAMRDADFTPRSAARCG